MKKDIYTIDNEKKENEKFIVKSEDEIEYEVENTKKHKEVNQK